MTQEDKKLLLQDLCSRLPYGVKVNTTNPAVKIVDINKDIPHRVSEVICVKCAYRWLAVRPVTTILKDLECPWCGKQGFVIETSEVINKND